VIDLYEYLERREGVDVEGFVEMRSGLRQSLTSVDMTELFWGVKRGDVDGLTLIRRL
jgi:hypothetical protein